MSFDDKEQCECGKPSVFRHCGGGWPEQHANDYYCAECLAGFVFDSLDVTGRIVFAVKMAEMLNAGVRDGK